MQDWGFCSRYTPKFPATMQFYKPVDLQNLKVYRNLEIGGCIAQLVEQLTLNQRVHGSSPCAPTKDFKDLGELISPR